MRTSIGLRAAALVVGLLAVSCLTKPQQSSIVISAVSIPKFTAATATDPALCACSSSGGESDFLTAGTSGLAPCVLVENRMPNNANPPVRVNTTDFQVEELHLTYENAGGPPAALPAGEIVVGANGLVPAAGKVSFPAVLVPQYIGATLPLRSAIRVRAYFTGRLLDHSKIKSSEYEYIVIGCGGAPCSTNCTNAPAN